MNPELARRVAFTLGALLIFRIGAYIPLPGTDVAAWSHITGYHSRDILFGLFDLPSAGTARHLAVFALGITPYIAAAILIRIGCMVWSRLRNLSAAGARGRDKIAAYTLYLTLILAGFQAYGLAHAIERVRGVVPEPGPVFELTTVVSLVAGTVFLVWLSNQITARGIGNGLVLILAVGLVVDFPAVVAVELERARQGIVSTDKIAVAALLAVAVTALIVFVEGARRAIPVEFAEQSLGGHKIESRTSPLILKLNSAGLIPTVLAGWLISIVVAGIIVAGGPRSPIVHELGHGHPLFMIVFGVLVVLLTLFYTAFLIDPEKVSNTLKTLGGVIRGVTPGEPTADYIDFVVSRVTLVGAFYLVLVFVVPELLIVYAGVPVYLGGAAFLIVVCATMDIGTQIRQEMQLRQGGYRQ
jgi:preprotein translocase subunit SecY